MLRPKGTFLLGGRVGIFVVLGVGSLGLGSRGFAAAIIESDASNSGKFVPSRLLIGLRDGTNAASLSAAHAAVGARVRGAIPELNLLEVALPPELSVAAAQRYYAGQAGVRFAEPDFLVSAYDEPNDPLYPQQWALPKIGAPAAWDTSDGASDVTVAIVDTGLDPTHLEFAGRIQAGWSFVCGGPAASGAAAQGQGGGGKSSGTTTDCLGSDSTWDDHGHGTHVAGIAAAAINNFAGVAGVAPAVSLLPVKVLDAAGSGTVSAVAKGIVYAADHGARVINLSLGGVIVCSTLWDACQYAHDRGVFIAAASGNDGGFIGTPAWYPSTIAVGASTPTDTRAGFSNYGLALDLVAPGTDILSTLPTYPVTLTGYGLGLNYARLSGTSMATPAVAGVAALCLSVNPALGVEDLRGLLQRTAADLGETGFDAFTGAGRVDAAAAVQEAAHPSLPDTSPPTVAVSAPTDGSTVTGSLPATMTVADDRGIRRKDFLVDGVLQSEAALRWWWHTGEFSNGPHTLTAHAADYAGNSCDASATVWVSNTWYTQTFTGTTGRGYQVYPFTLHIRGRCRVQITWGGGAKLGVLIKSGGWIYADALGRSPLVLDTVLWDGDYTANIYSASGRADFTITVIHP